MEGEEEVEESRRGMQREMERDIHRQIKEGRERGEGIIQKECREK